VFVSVFEFVFEGGLRARIASRDPNTGTLAAHEHELEHAHAHEHASR